MHAQFSILKQDANKLKTHHNSLEKQSIITTTIIPGINNKYAVHLLKDPADNAPLSGAYLEFITGEVCRNYKLKIMKIFN